MTIISSKELQVQIDELINNSKVHSKQALNETDPLIKLALLNVAQECLNKAGELTVKTAINLIGEGAPTAKVIKEAITKTSKILARIDITKDSLELGTAILVFMGALMSENVPAVVAAVTKLDAAQKKFAKKYPPKP